MDEKKIAAMEKFFSTSDKAARGAGAEMNGFLRPARWYELCAPNVPQRRLLNGDLC